MRSTQFSDCWRWWCRRHVFPFKVPDSIPWEVFTNAGRMISDFTAAAFCGEFFWRRDPALFNIHFKQKKYVFQGIQSSRDGIKLQVPVVIDFHLKFLGLQFDLKLLWNGLTWNHSFLETFVLKGAFAVNLSHPRLFSTKFLWFAAMYLTKHPHETIRCPQFVLSFKKVSPAMTFILFRRKTWKTI